MTVVNSTNGGMHLNGIENVVFATIGSKTGTYDAGTRTCSTTYCHGGSAPTWGGASLGCDGCHDAKNNGNLSTRHNVHYNDPTNPVTSLDATNTHTNAGYEFGCGNCHPDAGAGLHTKGPANAVTFQDANINGVNLTLGNYVPGGTNAVDGRNFNYTVGGTCTTYCHSTGDVLGSGITFRSTIAWDDVPSGSCNVCHDDATTPLSTNAHNLHIDNAKHDFKCQECHVSTATGDSTIGTASQRDFHVNGIKNVVWDTAGVNNGGTNYSSPSCNGIYCHSQGIDLTMPRDVDANPTNAPTWNETFPGNNCAECHSGGTTTGPSYANNTLNIDGTNKANSHDKHVVSAGLLCADCHMNTLNAANIINYAGGLHINQQFDIVAPASNIGSYAYNIAGGTCNTIACHGGNNAQWGATLACTDCHGVTSGETEDFGTGTGASIANGSVTATIDTTEWDATGHGRDAGNYGSGNPAANMLSGATNKCLACHDSGVAHSLDTNPFRLRNVATINKVCMDCHDTDSATAPGVAGFREPTQAYVGAAHFNTGGGSNQRHNTTEYNGGRFCWDCHDPHGGPNNTFMMGQGPSERLTRRTTSTGGDADLGIPFGGTASVGDDALSGRTATVTFLAVRGSELRTDFVTDGAGYNNDKICETCHDNTGNAGPQNGILHFGAGVTEDNHNAGSVCISCHQHNTTGFQGAGGDCTGCHDTVRNGRRATVTEFTRQNANGYGSHHVVGKTLTAFDCGVCHAEGAVSGGVTTGDADGAFHQNGWVDLRDVDNVGNTFPYIGSTGVLNATDHINRDNHCLTCHDANGASAVVTGDTAGPNTPDACNPFGDAVSNDYDQFVRMDGANECVVNVDDQFNTTNPSHHAVKGARYTDSTGANTLKQHFADPGMGATASFLMTSTVLVRGGEVADDVLVSCGDCHTGGDPAIGIHGSANEYLLRRADPINAAASDGVIPYATDDLHAYTSGDGSTIICFLCHADVRYRTKEAGHAGNASDFTSSIGQVGSVNRVGAIGDNINVFGYPCANCHNSGSPDYSPASHRQPWGGMHGNADATFTDGASRIVENFRFMPGLNNNRYAGDPDGAGAGWDATAGDNSCYTLPGGTYASCQKHTSGVTLGERHMSRPLNY
jgi:predicted CxxxxCH...CXXCH cytochrome family protein